MRAFLCSAVRCSTRRASPVFGTQAVVVLLRCRHNAWQVDVHENHIRVEPFHFDERVFSTARFCNVHCCEVLEQSIGKRLPETAVVFNKEDIVIHANNIFRAAASMHICPYNQQDVR